MTEVELDPTVIKRTQETLGKFVKKPPLTEKLLKKPPFRFLHDVFKAVIKDTGCFEGLYTADELNFENIKDRDDKMRFLQKMIDVIKITTKTELNVRTTKIVAGHEPERTNELLQLMGEIIEKEMDWEKAVKAVNATTTDGTLSNGEIKKTSTTTTTAATTRKDNAVKKDEKTQDKPKGKTISSSSSSKTSKEIKTTTTKLKEGQIKKSTPSPDDRTTVKKTIKMTPKEKEKVLSRQGTVEKITKEKEKMTTTKKSKDKTKDEQQRKRTTPSPVKPVINKTSTMMTTQQQPQPQQNANKDKILKTESVNVKIDENEEKLEKTEKDKMKTENENKDNINNKSKESLSKQSSSSKENLIDPQKENELDLKNNNNELENLTNGDKHEIDNRKTSPQQQQVQRQSASSIKSRKSSASKQKIIEAENVVENQNGGLESMKSLKTVNENEQQKSLENHSQQQQQTAIPPTPGINKREIPHENSRDSVGSNSNSSTNRPRTSLRPPSARPPSARPGAPRRRDKNIEIILQPNDQIKMSNINVKLENFGDLDDDGENLVIIEDASTSAENFLKDNESNNNKLTEADKLAQKGHLVQQILETQKELVQQDGEMGFKGGEKDTLEPNLDANARQSSARQMNNLRDIIQSLTKSVNPFGKLMDFIPEDIDAMQLEMNMWRDNYTQAASDLKREKSLTESATEPMKNQLIQIDGNIKEYMEMIDASRVKILQNSDKITKMLLEQ